MRRRTTTRRNKRQQGAWSPGNAVLGLAAAAGVVWVVQARIRGEPISADLPLSASAGPAEVAPAAGEPPAAAPAAGAIEVTDPRSAARTGPIPGELLGAFARVTEDVWALSDLRRLAVEFGDRPEAQRAREALTRERARCLAEAGEAAKADPARALELMTRVYLATLDGAQRRALRPQLVELSDRVLFSREGSLGTTEYRVQPGDVLARIARRHGTDYRLIKRLNGLKSDAIRVGQRLRIPQLGVRVLIFKRDFEVVLLFGDVFLRAYDCATGKDDKTPEAEFVIEEKLVNPDWYSPDGKVYPYGSEENILGTRWLAFNDTEEHQGFGIHGTKFPESIGTEASMGCIRLRNEDVEVAFDLIPSGSKVRVQR